MAKRCPKCGEKSVEMGICWTPKCGYKEEKGRIKRAADRVSNHLKF